jgi:hypothetical protein
MRYIHIIGGGTFFHVRPHLALSAPAFGSTARQLKKLCDSQFDSNYWTNLHLTRMAGGNGNLETNEHVGYLLENLIGDRETKIIFMSVALCDFEGFPIISSCANPAELQPAGKQFERLKTNYDIAGLEVAALRLKPAEKLIRKIRETRKDIFLVGFKTTTGATPDQQFEAGLRLLKQSSCNLVLANDLHTRLNMIITPEQARYAMGRPRLDVLDELVDMTRRRSCLRFTRTKLTEGKPFDFASSSVPSPLREAVEHCVSRGAYRPFLGKTVGHFAVRIDDQHFLTSIRGSDFNRIRDVGMVHVEAVNDHEIIAYGAKPSVGGQSQRIIFREHPETDSIVHFHCQIKSSSEVPVRSQREYECGSHECGQNTSSGLKKFGKIWAVMLDRHGPNIVFNSKETSGAEVIEFIEQHFDLTRQTSEIE